MMRISTTTLESFRLFMSPDQEWMTEDDLTASIKGEWRPNHKAMLGTAYGQVLEKPDLHRVDGGYRCGDFFFGDDVVEPALVTIDRRGVFEAKATKQYGDCLVVAKADHMLGAHLSEYKTTLSTFDVEKYLDSYQWRFMVDIFEPRLITYRVFCLSENPAGQIDLRSVELFNVFPYPALHEDCCALLAEFVDYVTAKGLDGFLRDRQRVTEAA
jgi:hypothetical protein